MEQERVEIKKDNIKANDRYYRESVERVIENVGQYESEGYSKWSPKGTYEEVNVKEKIFLIPGEGRIRYLAPLMLDQYIGIVIIENFNKKSETFSELKNNLEHIAKSNDPEELKNKFLSRNNTISS